MQDIWRASEIEIIHLQPCIYRLLYQNFMVIANQKSLTEEGKEEGEPGTEKRRKSKREKIRIEKISNTYFFK